MSRLEHTSDLPCMVLTRAWGRVVWWWRPKPAKRMVLAAFPLHRLLPSPACVGAVFSSSACMPACRDRSMCMPRPTGAA